jgi:O-antigen/teichoic acid export membrane protein
LTNIRVQYSGILSFFVGIVAVFTGLIFTLIVTRTLSAEEFGTWALINTTIGYLVVSEAIINFWTVRGIARNLKIGKTSFGSSIMFSFGLIPIYVGFAFLFSQTSNAIHTSMILGLILVPLYLLSRNLSAINTGFQPHVASYSLLVFEIGRIPAAFLFVYFLNLGLDGAILALFIAQLIQISFQIYLARSKIRTKFQVQYLKNWLKLSWLTIYSAGPTLLRNLDIALYTIISLSVIGIAYYSAAITIAKIVSHSEKISQGLYPKLLSGGEHSHISQNNSLFLFFGLPLVGLSIIFAKPGLYALNPIYQDATLIVILLTLKTFFLSQSNNIHHILLGIEKADISENPSFQLFLKSNLFQIPTFRYIKLGIYLSILVISLLLTKGNVSEIELITIWVTIALIIEVPYLIFIWIVLHKKTSICFPYVNCIKYLGATIAFMLVFWNTLEHFIMYYESIFDFLPSLIFQMIICISIYFGITYIIDKNTRKLFIKNYLT